MIANVSLSQHNTTPFQVGLSGHSLYSPQTLADLYRASVTLGMPLISQLCQQQFLEVEPKDAFEICITLGLKKEKASALNKKLSEDV